MQTICFVNQKGGVGKTTSCLNIGAALQKAGKRVLLIDMDAQGSLTKSAGVMQFAADAPSVSEMLAGEKTAAEVLIQREGCPDLLPSDIRLSGAEVSLIGAAGRDFILKEALAPLQKDYDFALIDCSPSLSILTLMALTASDGIIIPVAAQYMPLDGIMQLMQTVDVVRRRMNPELKVTGVIVTLYDARRSLDKTIYDAIKEMEKDKLITDLLGEHITDRYVAGKMSEWNEFRTQITDWELNKYMVIY